MEHATVGSRGHTLLAAVVSIIAGVVVLVLPGLAVTTFVTWGGVLLILVSLTTLFSLPRSAS